MSGHSMTRNLLIAAGLCAACSITTAQSNGLGAFAMSMHEHMIAASQNDTGPAFSFQTTDFGGDLSSITVLLDPGSTTQGRFHGLNNAGSDDDMRGGTSQGLNSFNEFTPKEDGLNVVPLPPAAFAGFGLLTGVAGVRYFRRIKR